MRHDGLDLKERWQGSCFSQKPYSLSELSVSVSRAQNIHESPDHLLALRPIAICRDPNQVFKLNDFVFSHLKNENFVTFCPHGVTTSNNQATSPACPTPVYFPAGWPKRGARDKSQILLLSQCHSRLVYPTGSVRRVLFFINICSLTFFLLNH